MEESSQLQSSITQHFFRIALGAAMIYAGIGHLGPFRLEFQAQVPDWVPFHPDLVVVVSGWIEIVLGSSLILLYRARTIIGTALAIFFVIVFPGNLAQYLNGEDAFNLDSDRARGIRLLFQPVLIVWALWSTGVLDKLFHRKVS
ncbi:hypothetical protein [Pelagicoccus sp. SDUM812002]|uniref:DoxX family protein n=1 Tax=Pelagicoccus sp. SDUM812002 TaxID=3041266 RepID=UPI00280FDEEE|nr:hypothetical protein [Pelagicoccus sp. SDUM812002]MDQ8185798.1 hypothetical protein [Pelagicoccus sp. SDUM812002]